MSAMEQMLVKVLSQVIPPEVMEILTPDNINQFAEKANAYIISQNEKMDTLVSLQNEMLARLDTVLERLENERSEQSSGSGGSDSGSN